MNLTSEIISAHDSISGWCSLQKQTALASIVVAIRPTITVEIGVWCGKSCIPIALAHKQIGYGRVIAVDPWQGDASVEGQINPADKEWWNDQSKHDWALSEFRRATRQFDVEARIEVQRIPSDKFECTDEIGLFHCDGNHGSQAMTDVKKVCPKVALGGFVVLDDLNWSGRAVSDSVAWIEQNGFRRLYVVDDGETKNQWGVWQRVK